MKYATAMSPARMNATGRVNKPSTISTPPMSSIMPLVPESDRGVTPVLGETGKLKYFDVPCSRNRRPTMMRKILSTRGDQVARRLSIAGIIISPMTLPHPPNSFAVKTAAPPLEHVRIAKAPQACSLYHCIGAGEQRGRHVKPDRLCRLEVDGQAKFGRLFHRQSGRLFALENPSPLRGRTLADRSHSS